MTLLTAPEVSPHALAVARNLVPRLAAQGAEAVVLTGSHARGTAHRHSDVDVVPLGVGPSRTLMRRGDLLVAVSWRTPAHIRRRLTDPGEVGTAVPTAREAVILHDPRGVAASIQREAVDWTWDAVEERCDGWVAEETARLAEEVHKLVAALDAARPYPAAMQRSVLALAVGPVLAVHRRLLYGREASLFELLAELVGPRWEDAQARSLGLRAATFEGGCLASLDLYAQLAAEVEHLFDARQRRVVAHALRLAETAP